MARLKSRDRFMPGEFQVLHAEAGMAAPFHGSFNECVLWELRFRQKNPHLVAKYGWSLDYKAIEDWVDEQNALRCLASGWLDWVDVGVSTPSLQAATSGAGDGDTTQKKTGWQSVVGASKRIASGAALLNDWLGSGKKPVERALAEKRAAVCVDCPKNDGGDFTAYFTVPVANQIRALLSLKHDLELNTPLDDKLTVCSGCDCPLPLKVWCPIDLIKQRMTDDTINRLDRRCWVLSE